MPLSGIRFGSDHRRAAGNVIKMKRAFLVGHELEIRSKQLLEQLKQVIVSRLQDDQFSQRDPRATNRGFGFSIKQIAAAVNTTVLRNKLSLMGGIGEITKLDQADPLLKLNNPPRVLTPQVRLWRILEYGTIKKKYPIIAKNVSQQPGKKPVIKTTKVPYTSTKTRKKKGGPSGTKVPQLRFFWKKANVSFRGPLVMHPGQEGRGIWVAVLSYEVREIYGRGMKIEMLKIVQRYSGR